MGDGLYDHGYGRDWTDLLVYRREGYTTSVADYHRHAYYEINLILSGNVRILLPDRAVETDRAHLVLTAPDTPHFIACSPDRLYRRLYLSFSPAFVEHMIPEWEQLQTVFGKNGGVVTVGPEQKRLCEETIDRIAAETDPLRQRLLVLYLLSHIRDFAREGRAESTPAPPYVIEALSYINRHYAEKIVASDLAARVHIGRTTLMTAFRQYTGSSLNSYLNGYRLKNALRLLEGGKTVQETAELCGFSDSSSLIRNFKREFGATPRQYFRPGD